MRNMTALIEKCDQLLAQELTPESVSTMLDEFDHYREQIIFKAKLNQLNKMTPELLEVFINKGV